METKPLYELHNEHVGWLNKIDFYKGEVKILKNRIAEIAAKNNGKEILAQVEHFQNQLIVQANNMDELRHSIKEHEAYLRKNAAENPIAVDHRTFNDHSKMREDVHSFEKVFNELRHELNAFLSKTL